MPRTGARCVPSAAGDQSASCLQGDGFCGGPMKSTAQIADHPVHPMLIPFPFALLSSAAVFDLGSRMTGKSSWSQTAAHLRSAGLGTALVAAVPGIVDYFGSVPA